MNRKPLFVPHSDRFDPGRPPEAAARDFAQILAKRRSIRHFSDRPVARETVEWILRAAMTAPSGANKQPWRFVAVSDPATKRAIREGAEAEERAFYAGRAGERWLADLEPFGTDANKEFLEVAPWLIVVFKRLEGDDGDAVYYVNESVGIACGMLLAAAQMAGLATLTHTPNPMKFLSEVLGRPKSERPFLLIPLGYAAEDCMVPAAALERRPLREAVEFR
ncbi:MAG: nitroreductase family protein [Planctomycetes bacterium]|nr:nitroreductase family protein [Planctomycetota bacterium]